MQIVFMLEQIRGLLKTTPFRPFSVYLADGRKFTVPHPDFAHIPKPGLLFYFHEGDDFGELVSALLITSIEFEPAGQAA